MKIILSFCLILSMFISCSPVFSSAERNIINDSPGNPSRVLQITQKEDSLILRTPSKNIRRIKNNKDLAILIEKLKLTMRSESGVGIAAPQIGINKNIFLFLRLDKSGQPIEVAINPKIIEYSEKTVCFLYDGCLSVPNEYGNSDRYPWIKVKYKNEKGETIKEKLKGESRWGDYTGVIFQHEYDHLQGILYIDKLCE